MQNPLQKFRQSSIAFEKPGILSENMKILTSSNYSTIQYFFPETLHAFPTYQCRQKGVWDFFYFVYILSYLQKLKNTWFLCTCFFTFLLITQDLNKINKIPDTIL